jgi:hypothetical protein
MQHPLAFIRDTCGTIIRLQMFESVNGLRVEDDLIVLSVARAKSTELRRGHRVTSRGTTLHTWHLGIDQRWHRGESTTLWWSTDELHAEPRQRDAEWEQMCYRPGSDRSPMDGPVRVSQGYQYNA